MSCVRCWRRLACTSITALCYSRHRQTASTSNALTAINRNYNARSRMPPARRSAKRSGRSSSGNLGRVKKAEEQQKKRAASRDRKWLKLDDGDEAIVRLFPSEE